MPRKEILDRIERYIQPFRVTRGEGFQLKNYDSGQSCGLNKADASRLVEQSTAWLAEEQQMLYAQDRWSLLLVFQAMDAAGKDSTIRHVMSGINPQGCQVFSFRQPSQEELSHDFLWRYTCRLPERGKIGIFNRSYYEETLVVRVHELYKTEKLPPQWQKPDIFERRYRQINDFEKYLYENGVTVLKFFLHLSKEEQKKRLLARIDKEEKNWKFSAADLAERQYFDEYQSAYEDTINATSTKHAPWHVIPADKKWYARLCISHFLADALEKIDPRYPELTGDQKAQLQSCRDRLTAEGGDAPEPAKEE